MKAKEILFITLLFISGFMVSEIIISNFFFIGSLKKFLFRIAFMIQYSVLLYLVFDTFERIKEKKSDEVNNVESEEHSTLKKEPEETAPEKGSKHG